MQLDLGTILGIAGILLGAFFSYYFYRVSLREKKPSWTVRSIVLIEDFCEKFENLKVLYKNENVANLTVSKIAFWNEGRETIDRNDIDTLNHLRISCIDGSKILDAKVLTTNNPSSQFSAHLSDDQNCIMLDFDYIDIKQGAVIQVVHTGKSSLDLNIIGDIKGVKKLNNRFQRPYLIYFLRKYIPTMPRKLFYLSYIFMGIITIIYGMLDLFVFDVPKTESIDSTWFSVGVFLFSGLLLFFMGYSGIKKIVPKGLRLFYE